MLMNSKGTFNLRSNSKFNIKLLNLFLYLHVYTIEISCSDLADTGVGVGGYGVSSWIIRILKKIYKTMIRTTIDKHNYPSDTHPHTGKIAGSAHEY